MVRMANNSMEGQYRMRLRLSTPLPIDEDLYEKNLMTLLHIYSSTDESLACGIVRRDAYSMYTHLDHVSQLQL
jgi:hypothetical protein